MSAWISQFLQNGHLSFDDKFKGKRELWDRANNGTKKDNTLNRYCKIIHIAVKEDTSNIIYRKYVGESIELMPHARKNEDFLTSSYLIRYILMNVLVITNNITNQKSYCTTTNLIPWRQILWRFACFMSFVYLCSYMVIICLAIFCIYNMNIYSKSSFLRLLELHNKLKLINAVHYINKGGSSLPTIKSNTNTNTNNKPSTTRNIYDVLWHNGSKGTIRI